MFILNKGHLPAVSVLFALILVFLPANIASDPFTGGKTDDIPTSVSRGPVFALPDGYSSFQLKIRDRSAEFLSAAGESSSSGALFLFFMAVFLYGILHGAGPGHRKTVIFTLFLSRPAAKWEPLAAGFLSAGLHAGTSILIFLALNLIWKSVYAFSGLQNVSFYLEGWTFIILTVLALFLSVFKGFEFSGIRKHPSSHRDNRNIYMLLIVSSMFPCPGATMLLVFALARDLVLPGILGVGVMSLGMGIVISLAGYLGLTGRKTVFSWLKNREKLISRLSSGLELVSYLFVAVFSFWMGSPFILSLFR